MTTMTHPAGYPPGGTRRTVVYATSPLSGTVDGHIPLALRALRPFAQRLIVVASGSPDDSARETLSGLADRVVFDRDDFRPSVYAEALAADRAAGFDLDEALLTGDAWFGPTADLGAVFERMSAQNLQFWEMVENRQGPPRAFPAQGFPARVDPWTWIVAGRELIDSPEWTHYWEARKTVTEAAESSFGQHFGARGFVGGFAFRADDFGNDDPGLFSSDLLVAAGCPLVKRSPFTLYPPYLHQHAVVGRDVVAAIGASGYPVDAVWQHLVRTVPPKALNTNAGMLEIITDSAPLPATPPRMVAVAHIGDVEQAASLLRRLDSLPAGYDLVITTSDGRKAVAVTRIIEQRDDLGASSVDVRVTPASRGRDMSDFFIGCRDVLQPGRYDLVVKVSARSMRRKTENVRRYYRRYQYDNLLGSTEQVAGILALFAREPGLGMVFPPMMHIGYATMGRAWGDYRASAEALYEELGIRVPLDEVSPLAPFGGMWFARPEAMRLLTTQRWLYRDYGRSGRKKYRDLARLQERAVVAAAAELGYHSRTVLSPEHAAISHTALEFKADQLFSTTRGYPVDSITLVQRAGQTGYGGIVGLSRMYLRLNHRYLSRVALPLIAGAQWVYSSVRALMGDERFIRRRDERRDEDL